MVTMDNGDNNKLYQRSIIEYLPYAMIIQAFEISQLKWTVTK